MRVLLALGGNAMTGPDGSATPATQIAAPSRSQRSGLNPVYQGLWRGLPVVGRQDARSLFRKSAEAPKFRFASKSGFRSSEMLKARFAEAH